MGFDINQKHEKNNRTSSDLIDNIYIYIYVLSFLSKIGITGRSLKVASNRLQTTPRYASSWIWSKA